jgi:membrane-associated phospholipid phosphatase
LFAGLSLAILMVRRDLGLLSLGCFAVIEFSRVYLGLHYLTDLAGSFLLAGVFVALAQLPWCVEAGRWFLKWERAWPWAFYACALLASFQLITAFHELRLLLRLVTKS